MAASGSGDSRLVAYSLNPAIIPLLSLLLQSIICLYCNPYHLPLGSRSLSGQKDISLL